MSHRVISKPLLASVALPAFILGHDPSAQIICISYAMELAEKLARDCRSIMTSSWYKLLFPKTRLSNQRPALQELITTSNGSRRATSVGGILTGRGCDLMIVDEAAKPEEAVSEAQRKKVNERTPIAMLTAYDFPFARIFDAAGVDVLLVGDSLGMVVQGADSTLAVTLDEVIYHTRMVARARQRALVVAGKRRSRRPALFAKCANAPSQRLSTVTVPSEPDRKSSAAFSRCSVRPGTRVRARDMLAFVPTMDFPARERSHADARGRATILACSLLVNPTEFELSYEFFGAGAIAPGRATGSRARACRT